jgi:D-sedoheptulose 7-phosphate isomerase
MPPPLSCRYTCFGLDADNLIGPYRMSPSSPSLGERIRRQFAESIETKQAALAELALPLEQAIEALTQTILSDGKLLICGNGGSAADAQHLAAELVGRFEAEREPMAAIALTTDTSILTAIGNDYAFEEAFARQVRALGRPGDLLAAISTSGNSPNVLEAKIGRAHV